MDNGVEHFLYKCLLDISNSYFKNSVFSSKAQNLNKVACFLNI